ncbi:MAG TPA: alpha/beta fold hydrolase [candidate division Zixibacteria bacterium]|nr:alpha/beta fold hydrolase [candidate division Zixibacteria bacterium]
MPHGATEERVSFPNGRGDTLVGVLHRCAKSDSGAVILCHGMDSNKESEKLVYLARALAERGTTALRFDFAYTGESTGRYEDITYTGGVEDLRAAYALVKAAAGGKIGLFGSSMGGTVALLFAAREPGVAALVTVAAPLHPERFPSRVLSAEGLKAWRDQGVTYYNGRRLNATLLRDLEQLDVAAAAARVVCPALVIHGDADAVVPVDEAYELYERLAGPKRLSILPGTDHRFSDPAMMERAMAEALDWLVERVR